MQAAWYERNGPAREVGVFGGMPDVWVRFANQRFEASNEEGNHVRLCHL